MSKLPRGLSGHQLRRALERAGFRVKRQKGSHVVMVRNDPPARVVVPDHRSIDTGTLAAILETAGLTADRLRDLL